MPGVGQAQRGSGSLQVGLAARGNRRFAPSAPRASAQPRPKPLLAAHTRPSGPSNQDPSLTLKKTPLHRQGRMMAPTLAVRQELAVGNDGHVGELQAEVVLLGVAHLQAAKVKASASRALTRLSRETSLGTRLSASTTRRGRRKALDMGRGQLGTAAGLGEVERLPHHRVVGRALIKGHHLGHDDAARLVAQGLHELAVALLDSVATWAVEPAARSACTPSATA